MDLKEAIKLLDYHQRWRQGIEEDFKYKPSQLTEALDIVLEQVKKLNIDVFSIQLLCGICDKETEHEQISSTELKCLECGNISVE
tara:strand:+ start:426 stop:680 length:255 start_codon:yes stop_codon:yes gene_type:complete